MPNVIDASISPTLLFELFASSSAFFLLIFLGGSFHINTSLNLASLLLWFFNSHAVKGDKEKGGGGVCGWGWHMTKVLNQIQIQDFGFCGDMAQQ